MYKLSGRGIGEAGSTLAVVAFLAVAPLSAQVDGGMFPVGWMGRADDDSTMDNVRVVEDAGLLQVDNGPAVVLWRSDHTASGNYSISAIFTQVSSKGQPNGAGLIVGGYDLSGPNQHYTYFLVRGDGQFLVQTRTGSEIASITQWTSHEAVHADDFYGQHTNSLGIRVMDGNVMFMVNGAEVYRRAAADLSTDGIFGVRVNQDLTILFSDLEVDTAM